MANQGRKEYKGYIIQPGLTMPAQDIHEYVIYKSTEEADADIAFETHTSQAEAIARIDAITGYVGRVAMENGGAAKTELSTKLSHMQSKELEDALEYQDLADVAEDAGYMGIAQGLREIAESKERHTTDIFRFLDQLGWSR